MLYVGWYALYSAEPCTEISCIVLCLILYSGIYIITLAMLYDVMCIAVIPFTVWCVFLFAEVFCTVWYAILYIVLFTRVHSFAVLYRALLSELKATIRSVLCCSLVLMMICITDALLYYLSFCGVIHSAVLTVFGRIVFTLLSYVPCIVTHSWLHYSVRPHTVLCCMLH